MKAQNRNGWFTVTGINAGFFAFRFSRSKCGLALSNTKTVALRLKPPLPMNLEFSERCLCKLNSSFICTNLPKTEKSNQIA